MQNTEHEENFNAYTQTVFFHVKCFIPILSNCIYLLTAADLYYIV